MPTFLHTASGAYDLPAILTRAWTRARNAVAIHATLGDPVQDAPMLSKPGIAPAAEQIADERSEPETADTSADQAGKPADEETPRDLLLADLRDAIDQGAKATKLLNDLLSGQRELLTDEDVKGLKDREKRVAAAAG